jgi:AraC-like DNA-binding protein
MCVRANATIQQTDNSGMMRAGMPPDRIALARDPDSGVEAIHASFSGHAYDLHRHDEWLVGVTDRGLQNFFCRGKRHTSSTGTVILIEPGELHDGRAGGSGGFAYRMLYLPKPWLTATLVDTPARDAGFRATLCDDPPLARSIARACDTVARREARLTRDAALDRMMDLLCRHLDRRARAQTGGRDAVVARRARECLHDDLSENLGADALARLAGAADRFHLARAFRAAYGTSPHAWLVQMRLLLARRLLRAGEAPARVAAECGFADQSHFGRWFRRAYGHTPAAYRAICTNVPDKPFGSALS